MSALDFVGNTPLIQLEHVVPPDAGEVWLKYEGANPTGSYKDRMVVAVLRGLLERGEITPGTRIVEYTGGSTGMSIAWAAGLLGLTFTAISSSVFEASKIASMRAFGAEVLLEDSADGTKNPELFGRMRARAHELGARPGHHYFDQFAAPDIRPGYEPMGREIADTLNEIGRAHV